MQLIGLKRIRLWSLFFNAQLNCDLVLASLGFSKNIVQARQLVNHGHITINKKVVSIPSFQCKINDLIGVKTTNNSVNLIENNIKNGYRTEIPAYLRFDSSKLEATVLDSKYTDFKYKFARTVNVVI